MYRILSLGLLLSLVAPLSSLQAQGALQPNDHIVICGDLEQGSLYSSWIESYLLMSQQTPGVKIFQDNLNEDRSEGLLARLASDVIPAKPSVVISMCRINESYQYPLIDHDVPANYVKNQTAIVQALKAAGVRLIIVGSPCCFDPASYHHDQPGTADTANQVLAGIAKNLQEMAKTEGVVYAPIYEETTAIMAKAKAEKGADFLVGADASFYPPPSGLLVMTATFLKALGCDGAIGTLTVDMAASKAQGTPGQKIVSFQDGLLTVESTRYPFYLGGDPDAKDPTQASIVKFTSFSQDLNRYMLVVSGLKTPKAKITWGGATKEFASADLAKGINLAAEFVKENPFGPQSNAVQVAVYTQQGRDDIVWKALHDIKGFEEMAGTGAPIMDKIFTNAVTKDISKYQKAAMDLVIPFQHTIKIEPVADGAAATTSTKP